MIVFPLVVAVVLGLIAAVFTFMLTQLLSLALACFCLVGTMLFLSIIYYQINHQQD